MESFKINKETKQAELKEVRKWKQSLEFHSHPKQGDPKKTTQVSHANAIL